MILKYIPDNYDEEEDMIIKFDFIKEKIIVHIMNSMMNLEKIYQNATKNQFRRDIVIMVVDVINSFEYPIKYLQKEIHLK